MVQGYNMCFNRGDNDIHETGIARIDYVNDTNGDLFYVLLIFSSMFLLMCIDIRNRYRFQKSDGRDGGGTVILPGYFTYLTSVAAVNLIFGVVFLAGYLCHKHFGKWTSLSLMSVQFGFSHFFYEAPTFFFLCNGGGRRDFLWALRGGGVVGCAAFIYMFVSGYYGLILHCYITPFYIFITFRLALILLYTFIAVAPTTVLYQRPALVPYSRFMLLYNLVWLFVNFSLFFGPDYFYCSAYFINFLFDGVFPPLVLYYALMLDSQYWQGCIPLENNPLSGLWDVDTEVVSAMASSISQPSTATRKRIPVIHYGMINIDIAAGFTAGGFSRVYAADFRQRRVAVKLLFAMELTPSSIVCFYKEAQILKDLQSEYVVECLGITIMPPALGVVMEYCMYGSLFDFLHSGKDRVASHFATGQPIGEKLSIYERPASIASSFFTGSTNKTSFSISRGPHDDFDNGESKMSVSLSATPSSRSANTRSVRDDINLSVLLDSVRFGLFEMMLDAASGLAFMHSKGFMHCDVKSLNYLVTEDLRVKLSDLGEARPIERSQRDAELLQDMKCPCPAVNWCPPECLSESRSAYTYTPASDVFSLTMVLYEIMCRCLPLDDVAPKMGYEEWKQLVVTKGVRPALPDDTPPLLRTCLESGWHTQPALRPSAREVVEALQAVVAEMKRSSKNVYKMDGSATAGAAIPQVKEESSGWSEGDEM